jgi:hypothetical protein
LSSEQIHWAVGIPYKVAVVYLDTDKKLKAVIVKKSGKIEF